MADPTKEAAIWMAQRRAVEALSLAIPVVWPGETAAPVTRHVEIASFTAPPARVLIGRGVHDRIGTLQILVKWPLPGLVAEEPMEFAGIIAEQFPEDRQMLFGPICLRVMEYSAVSDPFRDDGWWVTPIRIRWRCAA